jgi:catechol 2,3-dioxygenase-like lactoylglutathione lyase family enzyme
VGHVVLNVRSLAVSAAFYCEALGLSEVGRNERGMVFLSFGVNDHDLALREADPAAQGHDGSGVGVRQVAFRIGDAIETLRVFKAHLEARGIQIRRAHRHVAITSPTFRTPTVSSSKPTSSSLPRPGAARGKPRGSADPSSSTDKRQLPHPRGGAVCAPVGPVAFRTDTASPDPGSSPTATG